MNIDHKREISNTIRMIMSAVGDYAARIYNDSEDYSHISISKTINVLIGRPIIVDATVHMYLGIDNPSQLDQEGILEVYHGMGTLKYDLCGHLLPYNTINIDVYINPIVAVDACYEILYNDAIANNIENKIEYIIYHELGHAFEEQYRASFNHIINEPTTRSILESIRAYIGLRDENKHILYYLQDNELMANIFAMYLTYNINIDAPLGNNMFLDILEMSSINDVGKKIYTQYANFIYYRLFIEIAEVLESRRKYYFTGP